MTDRNTTPIVVAIKSKPQVLLTLVRDEYSNKGYRVWETSKTTCQSRYFDEYQDAMSFQARQANFLETCPWSSVGPRTDY